MGIFRLNHATWVGLWLTDSGAFPALDSGPAGRQDPVFAQYAELRPPELPAGLFWSGKNRQNKLPYYRVGKNGPGTGLVIFLELAGLPGGLFPGSVWHSFDFVGLSE